MDDFLSHFLELWSDPAHFAYEVSVDAMVNLLFLGLIWPFVKRAVRLEHLAIDEEHDVDHDTASVKTESKPATTGHLWLRGPGPL